MLASLRNCYSTALHLMRLPRASLAFDRALAPEHVQATYKSFTRPHPKYKLISSKTMGAALLDLRQHASGEVYLDSVKGRNGAAHHARRARTRGYVCREIERNDYVDDIHAINTSEEQRQGRPMDGRYTVRQEHFDRLPNFRYMGVLNSAGQLVAYGNYGIYGNFAAFSQLIGYRNNDGIMHMLVVDVVCRLLEEGNLDYLMYDTFFGAAAGMKNFKTMLGFHPYRANYSLQ